MKTRGIFILILVIVALGGLFIFSKNRSVTPTQTNTIVSPTQSSTTQPAVDTSNLQRGGNSYKDPKDMYVFLYPTDYKIDDQSDGVHTRIYKYGPTQKGQTEMYDGVLMVFETINLNGKTISQWVDTSIKTATADGTTEVLIAKKGITQNTYPGFTYTLRGLGEANYIVLQKDSQSPHAVVITTSVNDPQNVGFQKEVDRVLSTLQIIK